MTAENSASKNPILFIRGIKRRFSGNLKYSSTTPTEINPPDTQLSQPPVTESELSIPGLEANAKPVSPETGNEQRITKRVPRNRNLYTETAQIAATADAVWSEICTRRAYHGQSPTLQDYQDFSKSTGDIGEETLRLACAWSQGDHLERRQHGMMIMFCQTLKPVLGSINKLAAHPETRSDWEDLIQAGIFESLASFNRLEISLRSAAALDKIAEEIIQAKVLSKQPVELSALNQDQLDRACFVSTNAPTYLDPQQEAERADARGLLEQAILSLNPRHQKIINSRFPLGSMPKRSLEELAREERVTDERVRQIEARALRELRRISRTFNYQEYRPNEEKHQFKTPDKEKLETVRMCRNGVINALYSGDITRARNLVARLKVNNLGLYNNTLEEKVFQLLADPLYPTASDQLVDEYLSRFTGNYEYVRTRLRELETGTGFISRQIRKIEKQLK